MTNNVPPAAEGGLGVSRSHDQSRGELDSSGPLAIPLVVCLCMIIFGLLS